MLLQGDSTELLKTLPDNSVDAVVTDPPYGLSFMGKKWDYDVPSEEIWRECLRVLKPGGYLLSFAGTRTQHRMAVRIEDAGFEIRDMIAWVYGSGFPKSLNIGKAVDKLQGNEREDIGESRRHGGGIVGNGSSYELPPTTPNITKGTSPWEGWGTALKPALEPITVARKPIEGTVAENVLKWGVGGINIDGCRVGTEKITINGGGGGEGTGWGKKEEINEERIGRFPANLIHDNSEEVRECFPDAKGFSGGGQGNGWHKKHTEMEKQYFGDSGNASRFFKSIIYQAKASKSERNKGLDVIEDGNKRPQGEAFGDGSAITEHSERKGNFHPTVKPIALMEYLITMVSKEGATILDPFAGSGSTLIAAKKLKRKYIGIELDPDYVKIAEARLASVDDTLF